MLITMENQKDIVGVVHHLIERCKDGSKGFFTAAEDVDDPQLKDMFKKFAVQRDSMITELQNELHKMGKMDSESGSIERSEEHTSELQSLLHLVCRLLLEK